MVVAFQNRRAVLQYPRGSSRMSVNHCLITSRHILEEKCLRSSPSCCDSDLPRFFYRNYIKAYDYLLLTLAQRTYCYRILLLLHFIIFLHTFTAFHLLFSSFFPLLILFLLIRTTTPPPPFHAGEWFGLSEVNRH